MKKLLFILLPLLLCGCSTNSVSSVNKQVVDYCSKEYINIDIIFSKTIKEKDYYFTSIYYQQTFISENHSYKLEYLSYFENYDLKITEIYPQ